MASTAAEQPKNALAFGLVAPQWIRDPKRSTKARTLYTLLASYAGMDRITNARTPNRYDLAQMLDITCQDFDHVLAELVAAGWVTPMWRPLHKGKVKAVYQLNDAALVFGLAIPAEGAADETAGSAL